jgi:HEAT repeat protein
VTRQALILLILSILASIVLIIFFAFLRRFYRRRRFLRLDAKRALLFPLVTSLVQYPGRAPLERLSFAAGSLDWIVVEEGLLDQMGFVEPRLYPRLYVIFEKLGYVDYYLGALKSPKVWKRAQAAERLGIIRCRRAVPALIDALGDEARDVRNMAVYALGLIGDERGLHAIMNCLMKCLGQIEEVSVRIVKSALISYGRPAVKVLRRGLKSGSWRVRAVTVEILGNIDDPAVVDELSLALFDREPDVRAKAARGLGKKRGRSAITDLMILTEDPFWVVRLQCARALGLIYAPQAIEKLKQRLLDTNWQVRRAAAESLGLMKEHSLGALRDILLYHEDAYAREQVGEELQRSGLVWRVVESLDDGRDEVRKLAEDMLYAIARNGALSPLINALKKCSPAAKRIIVGILGRFRAERAVEAIKSVANTDADPEVRKAARAALGYP